MEIATALHSADRLSPPVYQVYRGNDMRYWVQPLDSAPLYQHAMEAFESFVCRNGSGTIGNKMKIRVVRKPLFSDLGWARKKYASFFV